MARTGKESTEPNSTSASSILNLSGARRAPLAAGGRAPAARGDRSGDPGFARRRAAVGVQEEPSSDRSSFVVRERRSGP